LGIGLQNDNTYNNIPGAMVSNTEAHTGRFSLYLTASQTAYFAPTTGQTSCLTGLAPLPSPRDSFLLSIWVHVTPPQGMDPLLDFAPYAQVRSAFGALVPTGPVIEGWQRVSGFISGDAIFSLEALSPDKSFLTYFDDLRIHPKDALMVSHVYNSTTFKLTENLDENNYFTRYKYNKEGQLELIQKETEKGILTIQSAYQATQKH
jgi:hypothetical protein